MAMPETETRGPDTPAPAAGGREFAVQDCALIALATGRRAFTLKEFRDELLDITPDSVYYHFWGGLLQPRFEEREYYNDFAAWARHGLHSARLAERLAVVDPRDFPGLEALQQELVEIVEEEMEKNGELSWQRASRQFEFIRSQIVVFDTRRRLNRPEELRELLPHLSTSSVFYHFIDARRRLPDAGDDFSAWLSGFGPAHQDLCSELATIDPYFATLVDLRDRLTEVFARYFGD